MGILLSDEEIKVVTLPFHAIIEPFEIRDSEREVAKAQLKKVVEWLDKNSLWCEVLGVEGRFLNNKRYQALLKEIE